MDEPIVPENTYTIHGTGTVDEWRAFLAACNLMPVPRCDQCKHWGQPMNSMIDEHRGVCVKLYFRSRIVGKTLLETDAHFGCVQFEAKP